MLDYQFGDHLPVGSSLGTVALLDIMGSDEAIVDAARISYDRRGKTEDRNLIRYLLRNRHTSPFEMGVMKFELKMPIFVARQWVRHRTASMNEVSARYTQLPAEMFLPEVFSKQSTDNKQGRETTEASDFTDKVLDHHRNAYTLYEEMLEAGVARELARGVLPLNIYTKFVWKMDIHNLMHFMSLRLSPHAQKEIREYAEVIERLVQLYFPITHEAFVDYVRDAYLCSRMEVNVLRELIQMYLGFHDGDFALVNLCEEMGMSKREIAAFEGRFIDG